MAKNNSEEKSYEKALNYAVKIISFQPKTKFQIKKKLEDKNFSPEIISDIMGLSPNSLKLSS